VLFVFFGVRDRSGWLYPRELVPTAGSDLVSVALSQSFYTPPRWPRKAALSRCVARGARRKAPTLGARRARCGRGTRDAVRARNARYGARAERSVFTVLKNYNDTF